MNKITINHGSFKLDDVDLDHGTLTVGRSADNDVQLDDAAVSSHHAKIVTFFNVSYIEDLDSTNGTIVNGRKVKKYTLHTGDILLLGKHQLLFTGSKLQQDHDTGDSTIVMTQSDLTSALVTATDAKSRENGTPSYRTPSAQSIGSPSAMGAPQAVIPQHQTTSLNQGTPIPTAQKTPIPESRPTQARINPAARPIPSRPPTPSPIAARVATTSGMSFSATEADDDEPLDEIFKDFVAPPRAATPRTTRSETASQPVARSTAPVSNKANQRQPTEQGKPALVSSVAAQKIAAKFGNMDAPAMWEREPSSPPPSSKRRIVVEDPSVSAGEPGRIFNVSSGINEIDRSAEYLNRAFASKGGHQDVSAVGDKTLLRQIITGDRDFNPSRNKFEIIQIVLGFVIFAIIALIAFSNF